VPAAADERPACLAGWRRKKGHRCWRVIMP
jgi:hypothetical protein